MQNARENIKFTKTDNNCFLFSQPLTNPRKVGYTARAVVYKIRRTQNLLSDPIIGLHQKEVDRELLPKDQQAMLIVGITAEI
jgi:hypothetical protein